MYNAAVWGLNVDLTDAHSPEYVPMAESSFFCLSGALALGLFIHNAVITIVKGNANQKNNARDTGIAFVLVVFTYTFIGIAFYVTFPLPKSCISDVSPSYCILGHAFDQSNLSILFRIC